MADDSNVLDQLISRIDDDTLRTRLAHEVELLRGSRRFGLVFDRHLPESVRLPDHPVRKGIRVALRDETSAETWVVDRFTDRTRETAILSGDGGTRPITDLVVVREFDEPIYPGLRTVERIDNGAVEAPWHVVINGENFHALQALRSTHRGKIDLIYIDPPYNTGNDGWIYNDRYVDQNDRAKSSKWLSFMERRLRIAWELLKPTGLIIAAIGDEEHHRLRMLLDQICGDHNFLADVAWQGNVKNDARFTGGGLDYMIAYARSKETLIQRDIRWLERKPDVDDVFTAAANAWKNSGGDASRASLALKKWWSSQPKGSPVLASKHYAFVDDVRAGEPYFASPLMSPNYRANLVYKLSHPGTGRAFDTPKNGWRYAKESMADLIASGGVHFGKDETTLPQKKVYLRDVSTQVPAPSFRADRRSAGQNLAEVLGDKRFPFPKNVEVLARWIELVAPNDAVILDFFGGSGATTEAVSRLNAEDGGARQSILVTNNEIGATEAKKLRKSRLRPGDPMWESRGVFEYVCRPRISTVITGLRPDGTHYSEGFSANVEMFDLTYLDPGMVRRGYEFEAVAPLMWLEAGARGPRIDRIPDGGWALTDAYGVLFDIDALPAFAAVVADASAAGVVPSVVFVITDSDAEYQRAVERLPVGVDTVQLYEDYLSNYTINIAGGAR